MKHDSIIGAVMHYANQVPDRLCIADTEKKLTYSETVREARRTACVLADYGVCSGDCVIVENMQSAEFFLLEFGVHLLGAVFVPVEKKCAADKVDRLVEQCGAVLFVSAGQTAARAVNTVSFKDIAAVRDNAQETAFAQPSGSAVSEILFSTGTTGREKGIVLTHLSDVAVAENIACAVKMRDGNVEMIPSPINHSHGLRSAYSNFINGGAVIIFDNIMFLKKFFGMMDEYNVNAIDLVPSALSMILKMSGDKFAEYSGRLSYMEFGSAPMADADREKIKSLLPGTPMYNFYGSTEAGRACVYDFNVPVSKLKCIGKATCNTIISIVDDERKPITATADKPGLIACGGSMCMECYYQDPEETAKAMADGLIYSNDEAYIDADGDIILLGRRGDVINIGGKKVSPEEIENAAKKMPGIADCGCIAVEDANLGQAPMLFVQMEQGQEFDPAAITAFLERSELESFMIPRHIRCIERMPRSFNGKLLRKTLITLK